MDKKINNDLQNATQKTKHWATRIWMENLVTWYDGFNGFSNIIFMYLRVSEWVSEWGLFQLYHGENKLIFNVIMMVSA